VQKRPGGRHYKYAGRGKLPTPRNSMARTTNIARINSTRPKKVPVAAGVLKTPSKRLRASRKVRSGDIRPDLSLSKNRSELVQQVAKVVGKLVQFHNGKRMFDEKGTHKDALSLQIELHHAMRPDRSVSEQAIAEACKVVASSDMVPTAEFVSNMPQLTAKGEVLVQPGPTGAYVFTTFTPVGGSGDYNLMESLTSGSNVISRPTPTIFDFIPQSNYDGDGPMTEDRLKNMAHDRAAFVAACVAPCLLEFREHINFFLNPATGAWLLPLLNVQFIDSTLPCKSKINAMRRDMTPAIAINGRDPGASNVVKTVLRDYDCPTYTVSDSARDGVPTVLLFESPKPRPSILTGFSDFLLDLLRLAKLPSDATTPTFTEVLHRILHALELPLPDDIIVRPAAASTEAKAAEPVADEGSP
jgi:hypothetical protein